MLLGELVDARGGRVDLHLKGSGPTPFSRGGDGFAVVGPMLREYLVSEAMSALGIPTTRALSVAATGRGVRRNGVEPGAVLARVASSHIRVGTFEYAARQGEVLPRLADYAIARHYPELAELPATGEDNRYLRFFESVIDAQAALVAKWMLTGFVHGVMNTDNTTISGETIDYGPCAFVDAFDPAAVFSSIDHGGRYAFGNQPAVLKWNLARFAETLLPLLHEKEDEAVKLAETELSAFAQRYKRKWLAGMRAKLGLVREEPEDETLIMELLRLMQEHKADYTNTFRSLTLDREEAGVADLLQSPSFGRWRELWQDRLGRQQEDADAANGLMRANNPAVIPRNHRVEEALSAAVDQADLGPMERLLAVLADPYSYTPEQEEYKELPEPTSCSYQTFCGT